MLPFDDAYASAAVLGECCKLHWFTDMETNILGEAWKKAGRIASLNLFEIGRTKNAALGQSAHVVRNGAVWKVGAEADLRI
jgi:hypothetical protein